MKTRGNYYANAHLVREDGRRFGHEAACRARTLAQACRSLDSLAVPGYRGRGYVQLWIESEQRRRIVAERDEAGNWWALDPFTGSLLALDPYTRRRP